MQDSERQAEAYARRHFDVLRKAGLTTWTFEEFFAFCRPLAVNAIAQKIAHKPGKVDAPNSVKAEHLTDAISAALQVRYGKPLAADARERLLTLAKHYLATRNRQHMRLT